MPASVLFRIVIFLILFSCNLQFARAQKATFEYLTLKDGLPGNTVQSIVKDKYGFMWFGTWNGLCRYDGYKLKVYNRVAGDSTSIANNRIHYIYKDENGTLWMATFDSFICRYNYETDNFTRFKPEQLPQEIRDSTNRLQNLKTLKRSANDFRNYIGAFQLSSSQEHLLFEAKPNNWGGINDNNVYCAYQDADSMLWLGTSRGGVNKADLRSRRFNRFSISAHNPAVTTDVKAMLADSAGIWLGTRDKGLLFISNQTKTERRFTGLASQNVRALFKDSHHNIWIGYRSGLDKYDITQNRIINYYPDKGTTVNRFLSIAEDPVDSAMWFGTFDHVIRYDRKSDSFEIKELGDSFNKSSALCLYFDSKNNLWIGTEYSGLIQLKRDPKTGAWTDIVTYSSRGPNPTLADERVSAITEDQTGAIWAGTANGLCRIDPASGAIKILGQQEGLSDQHIASLLPDHRGNIWISHKKGFSKLAVSTGEIRNYTVRSNFLEYEFMEGSAFRDKGTGKLYFGGFDGFVSFFPDEITDNTFLPTVVLTELQVLNKPVSVGQKIRGNAILTAPLHLTKSITLTHEDKSFSIEFAALHFSDPGKNQYAYMLEGVDREWIHVDASRRLATYANLPAGNYTFKVKGSNSDGVWNPNPTLLKIAVLPPWWGTWWAYAGYGLFGLLALGMVYRLVRARHQHNQALLAERLRAEKAVELDEIKSRFFTNISHEFRTPLTLIIDPLDALLSGSVSNEKVKDYHTIMQRNARSMLGLINQLLDFRKLESGNMKLNIVRQDVVAFIRNTMAAFEYQAQKQKMDFSFQTELGELEFGFDAAVLEKVLYNLISNAFRFTKEGGCIRVSLRTSSLNARELELEVWDNGPGISAELLDKIFEPFYQVAPNSKGGTGVGLALTKELVTLHKGSIAVRSEPYVASCFTITLPHIQEKGMEVLQNGEPRDLQQLDPVVEDAALAELQNPSAEAELVLLVEDNEDVRHYLKMNLSPHYRLIEAAGGREGYEKAIENIPDLIISDVMMPGMNGFELCRKLKTDEKTSHIPLILLTARQSEQYQIEGYETGADDYVGKPFNSALLLVRIKNLIDSRNKLRKRFNQSNKFNPEVVATNAADKAFLDKATKLIEDNMAKEDFNVEWMASQLLLSRTQLYRKIKALTDQSVHDFATTIRLNKAAALLLEGQLTVAETAYLVGYSDPTTFSRSFQKQFGITPKKYSQQGAGNIEIDHKA